MKNILYFLDKFHLTTTRFQITGALILTMFVTILIGGQISYNKIEPILNRNMQISVQDLATQVNGRIEELLIQAETLSLQAVLDQSIQDDLTTLQIGGQIKLEQQLEASKIINKFKAFSQIIHSIEIYSGNEEPYVPINNVSLASQITDSEQIIEQLRKKTGKLYWMGLDQRNTDYLIAIREIMLLISNGEPGGYEIVKVHKSILEYIAEDITKSHLVNLYDRNGELINANHSFANPPFPELLHLEEVVVNNEVYMPVMSKSELTSWSLVILIPIQNINQPLTSLKYSLILAGTVSAMLVIILSYWVASPITKSIYQVRKIMKSARTGQLIVNPKRYINREANELNRSYNKMVYDINHLIEIVYQKELAQQRAEIKTLQAQIHPHFLYNTLEAINWILRDKDEDELAEIILDLSELFRYTINSSEFVTLNQELNHIKRFLSLMKIRLDDKINWTIKVDDSILSSQIPKLCIQPIIENAIQHGIEPSLKNGHIFLEACEEKGKIKIIIRDTGTGFEHDSMLELNRLLSKKDDPFSMNQMSSKTGIGLINVHRRIQMQYGEGYGLSIHSQKHIGTTVEIIIPKKTGDE